MQNQETDKAREGRDGLCLGRQAELDIIRALALKAWEEGIKVEDKRVLDQLEGIEDRDAHKAFNRERYAAQLKGMKKEELYEALLNEAHIRYNQQLELSDERRAFRNVKSALHQEKEEVTKWKSVAHSLRQAVQQLMGF
jgi:hypothetical protein